MDPNESHTYNLPYPISIMEFHIIEGKGDEDMKPGEAYWSKLSQKDQPTKKVLWICCPGCKEMQLVSDHSFAGGDMNLTINPSLQCPNCPAHFWIKNGKIEGL